MVLALIAAFFSTKEHYFNGDFRYSTVESIRLTDEAGKTSEVDLAVTKDGPYMASRILSFENQPYRVKWLGKEGKGTSISIEASGHTKAKEPRHRSIRLFQDGTAEIKTDGRGDLKTGWYKMRTIDRFDYADLWEVLTKFSK